MWKPHAVWEHDTAWPAVPEFGGLALPLQYDPQFLMLTGVDPQDGWSLPLASVATTAAFPGIEAAVLPREIPFPPEKNAWDRTVELVSAASEEQRGWNPPRENPLFLVLGGALGTVAMSAIAIGFARAGY